MDEFELRRILYDYLREICHFSQMQVFSTSSYQKNYFQLHIDEAIGDMINFIISYHNEAMLNQSLMSMQQNFQMMYGESNQRYPQADMQEQQIQSGQSLQSETQLQSDQLVQSAPQTQPVPQAEPATQQSGQPMQPGVNENMVPAQPIQLREITLQELENSNGSGGKPAYVAVNGNVYDVTQVIRWAGGTHFGLFSGKDLSNEFMACHNGIIDNLKNVPIIGILKSKV